MAYLVSHIAICLIFAQLLGLLLGWLLWGYAARQRGKEVQTLRERLADMHFMSARVTAGPAPLALQDVPDVLSSALQSAFSGAELPERPTVRRAFFEEAPEEDTRLAMPMLSEPAVGTATMTPPPPPPIAPDLEAEVREAKMQHLQQQVRELEGFRDRLPLLQADLSDAIAGRRSAEARFQEAKNDFEVRSSSLLLQIRDFEAAAAEWDHQRAEFERERLGQQKELDGVKATLRDLQNSQRPQTVDAPGPELVDLRERYQRMVKARDALAAELTVARHSGPASSGNSARLAELEEALRGRDSQLAEQGARLESLLWRVAELEPFAAEAPQKEEALRRQESEIAGHMAMHAENASQLRSLQSHLEELQATTIPADELKKIMAEHQSAMQGLVMDHQQRLRELEQAVSMKEQEIAEHVSVRYEQTDKLNELRARVAELEAATERVKVLEHSLDERESQHQAAVQGLLRDREEQLSAVRSDLQESHAAELGVVMQRVSALEQLLAQRESEHQAVTQGLVEDHQKHLDAVRSDLQQSHAAELDLVTQRVNALEQSLADRESEHQAVTQGLVEDHQKHLDAVRSDLQQSHAAELDLVTQRLNALEQSLADREHKHRAALESALRDHEAQLSAVRNDLLHSHMATLDIANDRIKGLEKSLSDRDLEVRALLSVHSDMQREMEATRRELQALRGEAESQRVENAKWKQRIAELEATLSQQTAELKQQKELSNEKDGQLTFLNERLGSVSSRLAAHQQRLLQLEPLAARAPEMEQQLKTLETKHHEELTRLKVNSAQRIRRFRQSINTFKT